MGTTLPRVRVIFEDGRRRVRASRGGAIIPADAKRLADLDRPGRRFHPGSRFVPLGKGRWAIARGFAQGVTWRLGGFGSLPRDVHPAWLWNHDHWFDSNLEQMDAPPVPHKLRVILPRAAATGRTYEDTASLLAGAIAAYRRGQPVALTVTSSVLLLPAAPTRWFVLALLTAMPRALALRIRVSSRDADPNPEAWDLVCTDQPFPGFEILSETRPGQFQDDPVARFVYDRLLRDDPEAVEAAARYPLVEGSDPWRGAVDRYLTELPEKYTPASNPERAVDALTTQLRSDAPVDAAQIVRVSLATRDPAPWRALAERPASERTATVTQWVAQMPAAELTAPLARAVADARPPEVATAAWCRLLLDAMRERPDRAELAELLEQTLLGDDVDLTLRASSWTGLVQAWLESGDTEAAVRCFSSPVAERISLEGNARALTYPWVALPPACRDELSLHRLLDIIAVSQDSDRAIASIYGALKGSSPELVLAMLDRWAAVCADESRQGPPDLLAGLTSEERRAWARGVVGPDPMPDALVALIGQIAQGVHAVDIWRTAESAWSEKHASAPRDSLIWCIAAAVSGAPVAERLARELLHEVVARTPFPDADLADAAGVVAAIGDASPLWMWVAATAAEPRQFDDATLDATVVAFCEYPPTSPADREAAIRCAELLGAGPGWEPLDLARWVVRVAMAPHADDLPLLLLISLVQGLASRDDGPTWVAAVTSAMIGLHSEHPALQLYLQDVLPHAWPDAPPAGTASLVSLEGIDTVVADLVVAALGG